MNALTQLDVPYDPAAMQASLAAMTDSACLSRHYSERVMSPSMKQRALEMLRQSISQYRSLFVP